MSPSTKLAFALAAVSQLAAAAKPERFPVITDVKWSGTGCAAGLGSEAVVPRGDFGEMAVSYALFAIEAYGPSAVKTEPVSCEVRIQAGSAPAGWKVRVKAIQTHSDVMLHSRNAVNFDSRVRWKSDATEGIPVRLLSFFPRLEDGLGGSDLLWHYYEPTDQEWREKDAFAVLVASDDAAGWSPCIGKDGKLDELAISLSASFSAGADQPEFIDIFSLTEDYVEFQWQTC